MHIQHIYIFMYCGKNFEEINSLTLNGREQNPIRERSQQNQVRSTLTMSLFYSIIKLFASLREIRRGLCDSGVQTLPRTHILKRARKRLLGPKKMK